MKKTAGMVRVGIAGATGFAGEQLIHLLLAHPFVRITYLSSRLDKPQPISEIYPDLKTKCQLLCVNNDVKQMAGNCDLVFLALAHTASMEFVPLLLAGGKKVIDLSADYRLRDSRAYEKYYKLKHRDPRNLSLAVYGLPELYRLKIRSARLIANPGCYPTVSILALAPLLAMGLIETDSIIIDAKSGVTGAGRKACADLNFPQVNENFKAYKVNDHQHIPEIEQVLCGLAAKKVRITFVPHLLPLNRGILATIYARKLKPAKQQRALPLYAKFYKQEPFVRIRQEGFPQLKDVVGTSFCDLAIKEERDSYIIIAAIDNLLKGAAGVAVQNMNIMYGFPEKTALS